MRLSHLEKSLPQVCVVAFRTPAAGPRMDADLARAVLAKESCRIVVVQHRSITAHVDREPMEGRDGMNAAVVDCGDADLLIE